MLAKDEIWNQKYCSVLLGKPWKQNVPMLELPLQRFCMRTSVGIVTAPQCMMHGILVAL